MRRFFWIGFFGLPAVLWAQQCPVDPLFVYTQLQGDADDNRVHVRADNSSSDGVGADFLGEVRLRQGERHIIAPELHYAHDSGEASAQNGMIFASPNAVVEAKSGEVSLINRQARLSDGAYFILDENSNQTMSGESALFVIDRARNVDELEGLTWTTCYRLDPTWHLRAKRLLIDHNKKRGVAYNTSFYIKGTPVFWLPYFSFPTIDERASGFLWPSLALSDARGFEVLVPYYWNIAPNQDATFTLRPMTKRGLELGAQYRFLGERQSGEIEGAILPDDDKFEGRNRWRFFGEYHYDLTENGNWRFDALYQKVSDVYYREDIYSNFDVFDDWFLERHARLRGYGNWGFLTLQVQDYQLVDYEVDESSKPFSRLPQLLYSKSWDWSGIDFRFDGEMVRFYRSGEGDANRFLGNFEIGRRFSKPFFYIEPKLSLNARYYDLNPESSRFDSKNQSFVIPTLSVDTGLVFERDVSNGKYRQTLEPRLFYLYTPYHDQSMIPNFDTADLTKSWSWLFSRNRFSGGDKIGDANQLTTAITTRFYQQSDGSEKARFSIGQIQYFRDRRVALYGVNTDETNNSVLVSEGMYQVDRHWRLYGLSFWDPNHSRNERSLIDIRYSLDADRYLQIAHQYQIDDYDQISIGGGWRVNPNWRIFARHDYSLHYNRSFNTLLGIEYDDCCWAVRLVGRRYHNTPDNPQRHNGIYLEFIFKGLGNMGSRSGALLRNQLSNFRALPQER